MLTVLLLTTMLVDTEGEQASLAAEACAWLRGAATVLDIRCPPTGVRAAVANAYGGKRLCLALVAMNHDTDHFSLVVGCQRTNANPRGAWEIRLFTSWPSAATPTRVEVLPKGHYERVPPFTRPREPGEVDEVDTQGDVVVLHLDDRRRWLYTPGQDIWDTVYLGIPDSQ